MQVDFYLVAATAPEAALRVACRLCEKAYEAGQRAHVAIPDEGAAVHFDEMLWRFSEQSFVPHGRIGQPEAEGAPITIGPATSAPEVDILLNLDSEMPPHPDRFTRLLEVVAADEPSRQAARMRYKSYRDLAAELNTHEI